MKYIRQRHAFLGHVIVGHGCFFLLSTFEGVWWVMGSSILPAASTHSGGWYLFCIFFSSLYHFLKAFSSLLSNTLHDLLNVNIISFLFFWSILANVLGVLGAIAIELSAYWAVSTICLNAFSNLEDWPTKVAPEILAWCGTEDVCKSYVNFAYRAHYHNLREDYLLFPCFSALKISLVTIDFVNLSILLLWPYALIACLALCDWFGSQSSTARNMTYLGWVLFTIVIHFCRNLEICPFHFRSVSRRFLLPEQPGVYLEQGSACPERSWFLGWFGIVPRSLRLTKSPSPKGAR